MTTLYQCCFCGRSIEPVFPDVGGLIYTVTVNREEEEPSQQWLFCHTLCLLDRLHPSVKLYAIDASGLDE